MCSRLERSCFQGWSSGIFCCVLGHAGVYGYRATETGYKCCPDYLLGVNVHCFSFVKCMYVVDAVG